jgi:hypothetical protein
MSTTQSTLDSISLQAFKDLNGIANIKVNQGTGRMFADTVAGRLYFAEKVNLQKPLFVAKGTYDSYWVFNQNVKEVATL